MCWNDVGGWRFVERVLVVVEGEVCWVGCVFR